MKLRKCYTGRTGTEIHISADYSEDEGLTNVEVYCWNPRSKTPTILTDVFDLEPFSTLIDNINLDDYVKS